ncbi:hypothetical protein [Rubrobacter calidifluminis]|uniref:hypothetical protein n=1 Tax=Rubrobacter calidifluminis TaxID=1392640 RepID=UPI00236292DD|nr:hypothetical protein [Rubrobacter calidifluminis]
MKKTAATMLGALTAAVIVGSLMVDAGPARASFPGHNGRIVFAQCSPGYCQLFTVRPDGSGPRQLTATTSGYDYWPAYSARGGRIVYDHEDTGGEADIYSISAKGGAPRQITNTPTVAEFGPSLSPDGKRIAYYAYDGNDYEIYTIPAKGGVPTRITDNSVSDYHPVFSPNGKKIAYDSYDGTNSQIYTVSASGGTPHLLTSGKYVYYPSWSPDGRRIAYSASDANLRSQIYTIAASGGVPTQITYNTSGSYDPAYSPNGRRIAYRGYDSSNNAQIYTISAAGGVPTQITAGTSYNGDPDWQPNFSPAVTKPSPKPGRSVRDRTPTIAAAVRDGQQYLGKKNISLKLDGRKVTTFSYDRSTGRLSFTPKNNLSFGTHRVRIGAGDEFGLTTSRSWSFEVVRSQRARGRA